MAHYQQISSPVSLLEAKKVNELASRVADEVKAGRSYDLALQTICGSLHSSHRQQVVSELRVRGHLI